MNTEKVWPAKRQHLALLEDDLVLEAEKAPSVLLQARRNDGVARDRLRLVVAVGEHRVHLQFGGQAHDFVGGDGVAHDQVASQLAQLGIEFGQAGVDELDAAILARQRRQDFFVENKRAIDYVGRR